MSKNQPTTIKLNGQPATLHATNRAKFRFQASGGRISGLFDADHSYLHSIRLLHALLDAETRAAYPEPEDLCEHVTDKDTETYQQIFGLCNAAGWFPTAEELKGRLSEFEAAFAVLNEGNTTSEAVSR